MRKGQPLFTIYSPDLVATQQEYLIAKRGVQQLKNAPYQDVANGAQSLLASSRERLQLWDMTEEQIRKLDETGQVQRSVTVFSPVSGYVIDRKAFPHTATTADTELYTITDLSRVWIEAELYEYEAPLVQVGQEATLTLSYDEDQRFEGRVAYIYPYINPETRTLRVRFDFPNADLVLKPAMYVDVSLRAREVTGIVIPESAVLDTGVRKVAFVETSPGRFEPREVRTGVRGDGNVQILSGVQEGEQVVVKANFLLDSESRLRSALGASGGSGGHDR